MVSPVHMGPLAPVNSMSSTSLRFVRLDLQDYMHWVAYKLGYLSVLEEAQCAVKA